MSSVFELQGDDAETSYNFKSILSKQEIIIIIIIIDHFKSFIFIYWNSENWFFNFFFFLGSGLKVPNLATGPFFETPCIPKKHDYSMVMEIIALLPEGCRSLEQKRKFTDM